MKVLENDVHMTLALLRRHINPLASPLYRLPPDLFPEIASHLANETDLVNITHVGHRLRSVLLSHPSLWSHLNFGREMRARAFFERSGQTPLHIDMTWDATRTDASLPDLRRESRRIATLKLHMWSIQQKFLSEPLPSLRRLEIFCDYYSGGDLVGGLGLTKKVTWWSFPSLTSLIVYNLHPIPFHTPRLTCFKFWNGSSSIDEDKLLGFLDNCPSLEHIDIFYIFYAGGHRSKHDLAVSLPNLRSYTETTFGNVCPLSVLNMLSLPPFCSVTLKFCGVSETTAEADILPHFKNPDYLADIKRVKLGTTIGADGKEVAGTLELINAGGTRVRSERTDSENKGYQPLVPGGRKHSHDTHLKLFRNLDGRSVEVMCVDECAWRDGVAIEFLKDALCFGNVGTLILPRHAASWCLSILNVGPVSPIHTLIIRPDSTYHDFRDVLRPLLNVAQKRKEAGFPFRSISLFLWRDPGLGSDRVLEELGRCVEKLEVVVGDDVLDWDVDKYFLDGLDHLQMNRDVEWD